MELAPRPRELQFFCHGGTGAWKTGVERVGGRSASATGGVRVGIHDTEGINTLFALRKT